MIRKVLASILMIVMATAAFADTRLSIQGHLGNGSTPVDGDHVAVFSFYSAADGGVVLWTEVDTLHVQGTLFTATIGGNTPIPDTLFASSELWLSTVLDAQLLSPRIAYYPPPRTIVLPSVTDTLWHTDGTSVWRTRGALSLTGVTSNQDARPSVGADLVAGELHAYSAGSAAMDDGLLRLSAGGGTNWGTKSFIDLSGFSTVPDMYQNVVFGTAGTERMRLDAAGNVGLGTATPDAKLDVRGVVEVTDGDTWPDTRVYASFGVTRPATGGNLSYIGLTKQGTIPWGMGINSGSDFIMGVASANQTLPSPILTVSNYPARMVTVSGDFTATGTKCRLVRTEAYGDQYFNAVESGHALFLEEGDATIDGTTCHVELAPEWLAGVTIDEQHPMRVAITFTSEQSNPFFVKKGITGFDVVVPRGARARFDWEVKARQKGFEDLHLDRPLQAAANSGRP